MKKIKECLIGRRSQVSDTGTTDPEAGTMDPEAGTEDPEAGTTDPDAGTEDPEAGTTDPEAGTTDPEAGTTDSEAGTTDSEAGTTDSEARTAASLADTRQTLNLAQTTKLIETLAEMMQGLRNALLLKYRGKEIPVFATWNLASPFKELAKQGAPEDPISEDELTTIRSRRVQQALEAIKGLGGGTKETNVMMRTALWIAAECIDAALKKLERAFHQNVLLNSESPEFKDWLSWKSYIKEPLLQVLQTFVLGDIKHKELFVKFLTDQGIVEVDSFNFKGVTPLYEAIKENDLNLVEYIIDKLANYKKVSQENESALHVALDHPKILRYLVERRCIPDTDTYNSKGYTPIHLAVISKQLPIFELIADANALFLSETARNGKKNCLHLAVEHESVEIVEAIFKRLETGFGCREYSKYIIANQADGDRNTPFFAALQGKNKDIIELFLCNGAILSEKGKYGKTALEIIATHFNYASNILCNAFDASISISTTFGENTIDYGSFTDIKGTSQLNVIEQIVQCGQSDLLLHPLIKSYLYLKWNYFLPLFYIIISVHAIFLITFNVLVANIFYYRDTTNGTVLTNQTSNGAVPWVQLLDWRYWTLIIPMYAIITVLIVQESFTIYIKRQQWRYNFTDRETWMRLVFLVSAFFLPMVLASAEFADWQRHLACATLLLGWLQAMFLLSRFPSWGSYVLMFGRVAINLLKILASMLFLIIGFSFCFMIQYRSTPPFDGPVAAFFKTLVMMSSEFDYEDLFGEDHAKELRDTILVVRLLFGVFVVFVAIALMNFMTGAAVSDINELTVMAEVRRLEKQVQLLSTIEAIAYDGAYANIFKKVFRRGRYYKKITYSTTKVSKWNVISLNKSEKGTGLNDDCEELYNNLNNSIGTSPKNNLAEVNILEKSFVAHPSVELNEAFVQISRKKEWREEKKNVYITNYKIEDLHDAFLDEPEYDEQKRSKDWVLNAISEQDERLSSLAKTRFNFSGKIYSINCKIDKLLSIQTQTINEMLLTMEKMAN